MCTLDAKKEKGAGEKRTQASGSWSKINQQIKIQDKTVLLTCLLLVSINSPVQDVIFYSSRINSSFPVLGNGLDFKATLQNVETLKD